ncbi:unnamed protein product [Polarella glacialis]|uniref:Uncharacterized protein n=1 Tax=Polarella glacialis TaxID=89957 RepID=A0A813HQZ9_POLGL|nr:unnamed protein product [Polarella glacialis]
MIAWDLTREIHGAWRVPLTLVSERGDRKYSFVSIIMQVADQAAALGRSVLKEMSFVPLTKQRPSDVVARLADVLRSRGHDLLTVYLGLPGCGGKSMSAAAGESSRDESGTTLTWRCLKLSCRRQEWRSVLASCDHYFARKQEVCSSYRALELQAAAQGSTLAFRPNRRSETVGSTPCPALPTSLVPWQNRRGRVRLKVIEPLLVRSRRPKPMEAFGAPTFEALEAPGGHWTMEPGQLSAFNMRYGEKPTTQQQEQKLKLSLFKNPTAQQQQHSSTWGMWLGNSKLPKDEDCSSVSSASLEEYAEDFRLDCLPQQFGKAVTTAAAS